MKQHNRLLECGRAIVNGVCGFDLQARVVRIPGEVVADLETALKRSRAALSVRPLLEDIAVSAIPSQRPGCSDVPLRKYVALQTQLRHL